MSKTSESPPLNAEELAQVRWLLGGGLTWLAVGAVLYLDLDVWFSAAVTVATVAAGLVRPEWPARVPRWAHRLAFPAIAAGFAADLWWGGEWLPSLVRLDLLLLLYRGFTYRQKRDDLQVVVLGLFLIVVAGVLTVAPVFAVHLLAFAGWALVFMLAITLGETLGGGATMTETTGGPVPRWARQVSWRRLGRRLREVTDWRVAALGGGLFLGLVAVTIGLFLAIPRFELQNSLWLDRFVSKKAKTGFNDTIRFGEVTEIQQDTSVALSIDVSDPALIPASPYWRMLVLDEYRDGTFRLSARARRAALAAERTGAQVRGTLRALPGEPAQWTFYLEAGVSRYLPLAGPFGLLRFREPQNYRHGAALGLVALRNEPVSMTAYRVEAMELGPVWPDAGYATQRREGRDETTLLTLPGDAADQAALRRIVEEIKGATGNEWTAEEFSRRAEAWLGGRHGYSLQPTMPEGAGDPLVRWLVSREGGHCELFAGAMVVLARAAGLPARVVTGFHGGAWNGYSNNFTVRNAEAHAWCEIFDADAGGWRRADATPGMAAANAAEGGAASAERRDRSWTARIDSLRVFWYRRIVNFDQRTQRATLDAMKTASEETGVRLRAMVAKMREALRGWLAAPWDFARGGKILAVLVALGAAGWGWRLWRHEGGPWQSRGGRAASVRREAGRWLEQFDALPGAEAEAVRAELRRLRFGPERTWAEPAAVFRRARQRARRPKGQGTT